MAQNEGADVREALAERQRFGESELCVEIARSLSEIQTRIQRLVERGGLSETEIDVMQEIDRLLYDVVLDLTQLEAREIRFLPSPA